MLYLISFPEHVVVNTSNMTSENQAYSKKNSDVLKCIACVARLTVSYCKYTDKIKFSSKGLNKRVLEETGNGPLPKYRRVMDEAVNIKSTNRGFRTVNHSVVTYEQTKKGLSYFYPKRIVQSDGIHTKPLEL